MATGSRLPHRNHQVVSIVVIKSRLQGNSHPVPGCGIHRRHISTENLGQGIVRNPVHYVTKNRFRGVPQVDGPIFGGGIIYPIIIIELDAVDFSHGVDPAPAVNLLTITIVTDSLYG